MGYSSKLVESAVEALAMLPGVGKKTALRLALFLVDQDENKVKQFSEAVWKMRNEIRHCKVCHNLSDTDICHVCTDQSRQRNLICVVESFKDVMAIEETGQFNGLYHVLGGVISPIEGVGPEQLNINSLIDRINEASDDTVELVMAISPTIEGDTTIFYLSKQLKDLNVKISTIARGVSFGGELEYADELTLGRSIIARIPYEK
jgi:recombination protein RecR